MITIETSVHILENIYQTYHDLNSLVNKTLKSEYNLTYELKFTI